LQEQEGSRERDNNAPEQIRGIIEQDNAMWQRRKDNKKTRDSSDGVF